MKITGHRTISELADGVPRYLCRPLVRSGPHPDGAVLRMCQFCGAACWKTLSEPDALPANVVACCTRCALERVNS